MFSRFWSRLRSLHLVNVHYYVNNRQVSREEWDKVAQDDFDKAFEHLDRILARLDKL